MTVKELKEKLNEFDDNLVVLIPNSMGYISAKNIAQGVNEFDGCVFIDDYVEVEDEIV